MRLLLFALCTVAYAEPCTFAIVEYITPTVVVAPTQITPDTLTTNSVIGCATITENLVTVVQTLKNDQPNLVTVIPKSSVTNISILKEQDDNSLRPQVLPNVPGQGAIGGTPRKPDLVRSLPTLRYWGVL